MNAQRGGHNPAAAGGGDPMLQHAADELEQQALAAAAAARGQTRMTHFFQVQPAAGAAGGAGIPRAGDRDAIFQQAGV